MIEFHVEQVELPALDYNLIGRWLEDVAGDYGKVSGRIIYCFCDDAYILDVNRKFLKHDYYTDVITFDYSRGNKISGDILISVDTVMSNARKLGVSFTDELLRVIVHGVLHLCGEKDKSDEERERMQMCEDKALGKLTIR